jgi:hypothetical protein
VETNKTLYDCLTDKDQINSLKTCFHSFLQACSSAFEQKTVSEEALENLESEKVYFLIYSNILMNLIVLNFIYITFINTLRLNI